MTSTVALVFALSFLINDVYLMYEAKLLKSNNQASTIVYLISVCLLLRECNFIPTLVYKKCYLICTLLEIPLSIIILENSFVYIWKQVQDYVLHNADEILVHLAEDRGLEWLVCQVCCGKTNCAYIFADFLLKLLSFVVLFFACLFITNK